MRYKIGDVAKILNISPDLLRYYEKKGVVTPEKDKQNDYRYYDTWDINFLIDCIYYKNFGFSIEQVARMGTECDYGELMQELDGREKELQQQLRHTQLLLERMQEHRQGIIHIKEFLGKCDIRRSPQMLRFLNRYNYMYDNRKEMNEISKEWMQLMPFPKRYFEIDRSGLFGDGNDYAWGFSLDMKYVREFHVEHRPPLVHLPAQSSIHSAFKSSGKNAFTPRHLDYMTKYAQERGLEITGEARGNLVCSVIENGEPTGYFEVWLPIKGE